MGKITLLEVPFDEKNQVKALGGRWDAKKRKWFVPEGKDITPFKRWIPHYPHEFNLRAIAPFYVVESHDTCWKCGKTTRVITFASHGVEENGEKLKEFVKFHYVAHLPARLEDFVERNYPEYFRDYSKTTESFYFMNHCRNCGASWGDFFLHDEPEGAFFPTEREAAKKIKLIELKRVGFVALHATYSQAAPDLLVECAQREPYTPSPPAGEGRGFATLHHAPRRQR
jgi:Domain of unknown function (DUF5710)